MVAARTGLFVVTLIPLGLGFGLSAASARLVFILWGLVAAAVLGTIYWRGVRQGWSGWLVAGRLLLLAAAMLLAGSWLVGRNFADTDLGLRVLLPSLYRAAWTDPRWARNLAVGLAVSGTLCIIVSHGVGQRASRSAAGRRGAPS
jgi:hypothetical protein